MVCIIINVRLSRNAKYISEQVCMSLYANEIYRNDLYILI